METCRIFISHSWTYEDHYDRIIELLSEAPDFSFEDCSIPKGNRVHTDGTDSDLEDAIFMHMFWCDVVLVLAGVYATYSKWIDIELDLAQKAFKRPKPIVAIEPWGSKRTSTRVKDAANQTVKWNTDSIVNAIRKLV